MVYTQNADCLDACSMILSADIWFSLLIEWEVYKKLKGTGSTCNEFTLKYLINQCALSKNTFSFATTRIPERWHVSLQSICEMSTYPFLLSVLSKEIRRRQQKDFKKLNSREGFAASLLWLRRSLAPQLREDVRDEKTRKHSTLPK